MIKILMRRDLRELAEDIGRVYLMSGSRERGKVIVLFGADCDEREHVATLLGLYFGGNGGVTAILAEKRPVSYPGHYNVNLDYFLASQSSS